MGHGPFFWVGDFAKSLRSALNINDQIYIINGSADPTSVAQNAPKGSVYFRTGVSGGTAYLKQDNGSTTNWLILSTGVASASTNLRFTLSGETVPYVCIDGSYYVSATNTISTVNISALNSGTSGSTVIQLNQYRSGVLFDSATASLTSAGGAPSGTAAGLSGSLSVVSGDILTCDINSVAGGAPSELSVQPVFT